MAKKSKKRRSREAQQNPDEGQHQPRKKPSRSKRFTRPKQRGLYVPKSSSIDEPPNDEPNESTDGSSPSDCCEEATDKFPNFSFAKDVEDLAECVFSDDEVHMFFCVLCTVV